METKWLNAWLDAQQGYWKSWADLTQRGMKVPEAPKNPWAEAVDQWWQTVSPMAPSGGREVFDRLMDVSRGYFSLGERFFTQGQNGETGMEALNGWLNGMQKMWTDWLQTGTQFRPEAMGKGFSTFWDLPLDTWQRLAANVMPMPGDFTQAYHPDGLGQPMRDQVNRFLSIPAVGYTRESQEQFQTLAQRQMDYAAAMQGYQAAFGKLAVDTTHKFQGVMQKRGAEGKTISSLRELYDQWVEMSEAAYAEFVMTKEYQELYGRLINTLLALKQHMARMVDQGLEAMHMPSHSEIRTLQCRQQEVRRENLRLRKEIKSIQQQLDELRAQLQATPASEATAPAAKAAKTEAASGRKPAGKTK